MCAIYRCFPLHLLLIFVTGPSLHCLEGNSLECSIRLLRATHDALFSDLHPSMPDGVHGPLFILHKKIIQYQSGWGQLLKRSDTCSVTGGSITYLGGGGTNAKDPKFQLVSSQCVSSAV